MPWWVKYERSAEKDNRSYELLQTVQKTTDNLPMDRQCKKQQTIYLWTDSAKNNRQFTYGQTVQKNNRQFTYGQTVQKTTDNLHMDRQCKKLHWSIYSAPDSAKNTTTAIYIWTVHIYRLYRDNVQTYIYSVHIVYYKDILNYQRHIIHRMGTSALCTVSIHNVVYA